MRLQHDSAPPRVSLQVTQYLRISVTEVGGFVTEAYAATPFARTRRCVMDGAVPIRNHKSTWKQTPVVLKRVRSCIVNAGHLEQKTA